jgi:hypothetical protein
MTCLFMPGLRVELKPDDVSRVRNIVRHYQASRPTGGP